MKLTETRGQWLMEWQAYPRALVAALLQAHRLPSGYEVPSLTKSEAYSLRVRLQKMQAGLRRQAAHIPQELADAAAQVKWAVIPTSPASYTVHGLAVAAAPPPPLPQTLPATLVGDAILARLLTDTPDPTKGSHL